MKRTKTNGLQTNQQITGSVVGRAQLAARLGITFGGDRNLYQALGYKTELNYVDYLSKYSRQDIAKAIINRPVNATWRGDIEILESKDDEQTQLEKGWKILVRDLRLKGKLVRLDRLTCIGDYGIMLLGFNDVNDKDGMREPVQKGQGRKLLYAKPLSQANAAIKTWEKDPKHPRFGLPVIYELSLAEPGSEKTYVLQVHYSRILHTTFELLEDEVIGESALKAVFNRLDDLEKLVGGSAEMFWKGARPGYGAKVDKEFNMDAGQEEELEKQIDEYEHGLRRILMAQGMDLSSLAMQIADPDKHVDIQIQMISALTGIPKRVLTGTERGELASSQDTEAWKELIQERREEYAETKILIPLIDRLIEYGVLPEAQNKEDGYTIQWSDLFAPSEKEKSEVGKTKASALKEYASNPGAESIIPVEAFMEYFLGLGQEQINIIKEMRETAIREEEQFVEEEEEEVIPTPEEENE